MNKYTYYAAYFKLINTQFFGMFVLTSVRVSVFMYVCVNVCVNV